MYIRIIILLLGVFMTTLGESQVMMRDSVLTWRHHAFTLKEDGSMDTYTTDDANIQEVTFNAKVIENEYIRLVLVPEYGGRVISFYHKPTQHEYLYQSECGSAYGIGEGNFYYNWLMVWGGIFPTFPEPEHGKTWFLPWDFSVVKNSTDTVTVSMEFTDDSSFSGAPGGFNNGITGITCRIDLSVYYNSTLWDYDVTLINNKSSDVKYEYWTCTTLAPGSESGDTGTPLNSEMVIPVDTYFAGWSPGAWIGSNNGVYDFAKIDYLNEWQNMGIAYAKDFDNTYWGVINHQNDEGIFRISENIETTGLKLWTWGRNNIDNDLFDFSNGGADNYIELWAGVSDAFFRDAVLGPNETKSWNEAYSPTVGMSSIDQINRFAAINLSWDESKNEVSYELNTFQTDQDYLVSIRLESDEEVMITEEQVSFGASGLSNTYSLEGLTLPFDSYSLRLDLHDLDQNLILTTSEIINAGVVTSYFDEISTENPLSMHRIGNNNVRLELPETDQYVLKVINMNGQTVVDREFFASSTDLHLTGDGLYIIQVANGKARYTAKLFVR